MKKIIILSLFGVLLYHTTLQAQNNTNSFTIGIDPLVIAALGGVEVELGYNFGKNRVGLEFLGAELPPVWDSQIADFSSVSANIYELSYSRFLNDRQTGFHYGLAYSLFSNYTVENEAGESLSKNVSKIGVRLGYMWFPFKKANFFIEPLFNFGVYLGNEELNFTNGSVFEAGIFAGSGPVLHLGWKFDLQ